MVCVQQLLQQLYVFSMTKRPCVYLDLLFYYCRAKKPFYLSHAHIGHFVCSNLCFLQHFWKSMKFSTFSTKIIFAPEFVKSHLLQR